MRYRVDFLLALRCDGCVVVVVSPSDARLHELAELLEEKNSLVKRLQAENARLRDSAPTSAVEAEVGAQLSLPCVLHTSTSSPRPISHAVCLISRIAARSTYLTCRRVCIPCQPCHCRCICIRGCCASCGCPPQLQERIATHEKERRAIQTIMEQKIKALTDAIAAVAVTDLTSPSAGARNLQRLVHEVHALQRLVNASIAALRNSETEKQRAAAASAPAASSSTTPPSGAAGTASGAAGVAPPPIRHPSPFTRGTAAGE